MKAAPIETQSANDLLRSWVGCPCEAARGESWHFVFGAHGSLDAGCPWRLMADGRIALCDGDDGQIFGLSKPIDAESVARELLVGKKIMKVSVAEVTSDLTITFEGGVILQFLSNSSGYEAWTACVLQSEGRSGNLVAMGGGGLVSF